MYNIECLWNSFPYVYRIQNGILVLHLLISYFHGHLIQTFDAVFLGKVVAVPLQVEDYFGPSLNSLSLRYVVASSTVWGNSIKIIIHYKLSSKLSSDKTSKFSLKRIMECIKIIHGSHVAWHWWYHEKKCVCLYVHSKYGSKR